MIEKFHVRFYPSNTPISDIEKEKLRLVEMQEFDTYADAHAATIGKLAEIDAVNIDESGKSHLVWTAYSATLQNLVDSKEANT